MILYHLAWEYSDYNAECEWVHFVSDKQFYSSDETLALVHKYIRELQDLELEDELPEVENYWLESITQCDGYNIRLERTDE